MSRPRWIIIVSFAGMLASLFFLLGDRTTSTPLIAESAEEAPLPGGSDGRMVHTGSNGTDKADPQGATADAGGSDDWDSLSPVEQIASFAESWWWNCHSGPLRKIPDNVARLRAAAADPARPQEKRELARNLLEAVEPYEHDWDVQICATLFAE